MRLNWLNQVISHDVEENGMTGTEHEYNLQRTESRV